MSEQEVIIDNDGAEKRLKNATAALILGIISIPSCICYGFIAITLGIVTLAITKTEWKEAKMNPEGYHKGDFNNMKAGRICAIIGLCLGGAYLVFLILYLLIVGAVYGSIFSTMMDGGF